MDDAPGVPARLVSTLVAYARYADQEGRGSYPASSTVALQTRKSAGQARKDAAELERLGLLLPGDPGLVKDMHGGRRPNVYDLPVSRRSSEGTPQAESGRSPRGTPQAESRGSSKRSPQAESRRSPGAVEAIVSPRRGVRLDEHKQILNRSGTPPQPSRTSRDPRTLLDGLGVDGGLGEFILAWLKDNTDDPFAYLLAVVGNDRAAGFVEQRRRELADLDDDDDPPPPKPPWCGECDEETRLVGMHGDRPARCIRCHPLSVTRPEPEPEPSGRPDDGEYPF
jgi:hypothetical protein